MKRSTKIWLIIAAALILVGGCVFTAALAATHWDFTGFSTVQTETNTYEIDADFRNISIRSETEDITFVPSADGKCRVTFVEKSNERHTATVQDGTLIIKKMSDEPQFTVLSSGSSSITVSLPKGEYGTLLIDEHTGMIDIPGEYLFESIDLSVSTGDVSSSASSSGRIRIKTSTGHIRIQGVSAGELELTVSTGTVKAYSVSCAGNMEINVSTGKSELKDVTCGSFSSDGTTGDITLENVIVKETLTISRSTGDVTFKGCDAGELLISTDTGDVAGNLLSEKVFIAKSNTGRIDVPETVTGGKCKITTTTGKIEITVPQN